MGNQNMKSIVIVTAFASSTSAFSVANIGRFMKKANTVTLYSTKPVLETTPEKTITDPLGLYSDNSIEKKEGLLQPLDNTETETIKKNIRDPMGLYPKGSIEREEGLLQESNTPKDERAVRDPLGLYSREAPERQDGLIKPLEIVPEPEGIVKDPLNLYMNKDEIDEKSEMSLSLPFLTRPKMLDGSLPGDRGFDPLNFSKDRESLAWYRNAEIKHARIAMLAAIGWPISELWDEKLAEAKLTLKSSLVLVGSTYFWLTRRMGTPLILNGPVTSKSPLSSCLRNTTRLPRCRPATRMSTEPGTIPCFNFLEPR